MRTEERREYFRIHAFARVGFRPLAVGDLDSARRRIRARNVPAILSPGSTTEAGLSAERRIELDLLRHIALTLERIDRRMEDTLARRSATALGACKYAPVEISLSGAGFSGPFELSIDSDELVEVDLDLWESGLPCIPAIARAVASTAEDPRINSFCFEELHPEDEDQIVRLTLQSQLRL
ncbi:MAG: hypothetical protein GY725_02715 [bacterium]|nr:hypothetical protein [bacterium]